MLDELSPLLIGADPFRIEHLWHLAYRVRPFRGNILSAAVSAIDLALWDIKGKALKLPVWELLGGRTRDRVRLHVLVGGGTPDEIVSSVNWAVEEGFTAVKFDPLVHGYEDLSMSQLVSSACSMACRGTRGRRRGDRPDLRAASQARPGQGDRGLQRPRPVPSPFHRGPDSDRLDRHPGRDLQAHRLTDRDWRDGSARSGSSASCSRATSPSSSGPTSALRAVFRDVARSLPSPRRTTAGSCPTTSSVPASPPRRSIFAPRSRIS